MDDAAPRVSEMTKMKFATLLSVPLAAEKIAARGVTVFLCFLSRTKKAIPAMTSESTAVITEYPELMAFISVSSGV